MSRSVALTEEMERTLREHLSRADSQEDLCFALWNPSYGHSRNSALIDKVILPLEGDRNVHGNASFNPQYVERVIGEAISLGRGIAFLHSHPGRGWQDMSSDDVRAEQLLAPTVLGTTELPIVGLTLGAHDGAWSARFWEKTESREFQRLWCDSVRVVGTSLRMHYYDKLRRRPLVPPTQIRTVSAWGEEAQANLARIKIGIVGLGSVGSIVAEALARLGFVDILLIDYDTIKEHNLDRTLNAYRKDVARRRSKVSIAADALRHSSTASSLAVDTCEFSVCEQAGYRRALDCDVLFSCVDRPWPRSVLNFIAYAHLIPVIDGGIIASRTGAGKLRGADWKAHVAGPSHRCLRCLQQYDPGFVAVDRRGDLDDPRYLETLPEDHPARASQNVFGFSLGLASLEIGQLLMLALRPLGLGPLPQNFHLITGTIDIGKPECDEGCKYPELTASGEREHPGTGEHLVAEEERQSRVRAQSGLDIWGWLKAICGR